MAVTTEQAKALARAAALARAQQSVAQQPSPMAASNPSEYDPSSSAYQAKYGPVANVNNNPLPTFQGGSQEDYQRFLEQMKGWRQDPSFSSSGELSNLVGGIGKKFTDFGLGVRQLVGKGTYEEAKTKRELDRPLANTGAGKVGGVIGGAAIAAPAAFIPGVNTVVGGTLLGGALGAAEPATSGSERALNTGIGAAGGALTTYAGNKVSGWLGGQQPLSTEEALKQRFRDAGLVVSPSAAKPDSVAAGLAEGAAGKLTTAQMASAKNRAAVDSLAAQEVGINGPIDVSTLNAARAQAGQAYEAIRQYPGQFVSDTQFRVESAGSVASLRKLAAQFPTLAKSAREAITVADEVSKPRFDPDTAVDALSMLRENASVAYAAGNKTLGKAYRGMSDALEGMIERHLAYSNQPQLLTELQAARQLIAKTYTIQDALKGGHVDATSFARALDKGKPLTGNLQLLGEFAKRFPSQVSQAASTKSLPMYSPLDYTAATASMAAALATGNPLVALPAAYAAGRPLVRSAILSNPIQNALMAPGRNALPSAFSAPLVGGVNALALQDQQ